HLPGLGLGGQCGLEPLVGLHHRTQPGLLPAQLLQRAHVVGGRGDGEALLDLVVALEDAVEAGDGAQTITSSKPSAVGSRRTASKAVMATSIWSGSGSRVVRYWAASTGTSSRATTGLAWKRAPRRISSKAMAAITGTRRMRERISRGSAGRPT